MVYDVTDEQSFQNIRNWIRNIEQHAADNVDKVLIGNKCDMQEEQVVERSRGQRLADEYHIKLFETSAKSNINVAAAFISIAQDIKRRLMDNPNTNQTLIKNSIDVENRNTKSSNSRCCN